MCRPNESSLIVPNSAKRLIHISSQSLAPIREYDQGKKQSEIESANRLWTSKRLFRCAFVSNKVTILLISDDL